jgi:SAM-dependent methyltransferase
MSIGPSSSYDELPYGDNCFPDTHPDYLATVGRLFGIDSPDVRTCRVLELGCAGGGNLIPMALEFPEGRFVGVDLSARQIESARSTADRLGLENVELRAMSIIDVDDRFGSFDYIVCHGVYSWVPEAVRDKILEVCSARLAPNGIAYLSYNTYPGWHARGMVRDLMAFHVRGAASAIERVERARDLLEDVVRIIPDQDSSYARILRTEGEFLRGVPDSYLFHEHLEETNHPIYFREMVALARAKGLQYLAEARTPGLLDNLPAASRERIESWAEDRLAAEQYLDFLCNRTFRRSLLCRADCARLAEPSPVAVASSWVNSNVVPV